MPSLGPVGRRPRTSSRPDVWRMVGGMAEGIVERAVERSKPWSGMRMVEWTAERDGNGLPTEMRCEVSSRRAAAPRHVLQVDRLRVQYQLTLEGASTVLATPIHLTLYPQTKRLSQCPACANPF